VTLRNDKNFALLPADRGNVSMAMFDQDCRYKMRSLLNDPVFGQLTTDSTNKTETNTIRLIRKSGIPENPAINLTPHGTVPKTHKLDETLRPLTNCTSSLAYGMAST
jgi:hypothetical protein